jgi:hypothetical protein
MRASMILPKILRVQKKEIYVSLRAQRLAVHAKCARGEVALLPRRTTNALHRHKRRERRLTFLILEKSPEDAT